MAMSMLGFEGVAKGTKKDGQTKQVITFLLRKKYMDDLQKQPSWFCLGRRTASNKFMHCLNLGLSGWMDCGL